MTKRTLGKLALWLGCIFFCGWPAPAQEGLKAIENPGGGRILYGRVAGQTTAAGAMGKVLRSIHGEYGAAPQPGRPFRVRGTDSVAAYFTVARSVPDEGPLAGLIVASASAPGHMEVGVVYDAAARFASTIAPLLTALFQSWRPSLGEAFAGLPPMHHHVLPDQTASGDLPDDWKILPGSAIGNIVAEGPHGEAAQLGFTMGVIDPGHPHASRDPECIRYPFNRDLSKMFVDLIRLYGARNHLSAVQFELTTAKPVTSAGAERCVHLTGQVDPQDGKGLWEINSVLCSAPPSTINGFYAPVFYRTAVPKDLADKERSTMRAILATFAVNRAAVRRYMDFAINDPVYDHGKRVERYIGVMRAPEFHVPGFAAESAAFDKDKRFSFYIPDPEVIEDIVKVPGDAWSKAAGAVVASSSALFEFVNPSGSIER